MPPAAPPITAASREISRVRNLAVEAAGAAPGSVRLALCAEVVLTVLPESAHQRPHPPRHRPRGIRFCGSAGVRAGVPHHGSGHRAKLSAARPPALAPA